MSHCICNFEYSFANQRDYAAGIYFILLLDVLENNWLQSEIHVFIIQCDKGIININKYRLDFVLILSFCGELSLFSNNNVPYHETWIYSYYLSNPSFLGTPNCARK